ncbi:uncharacterized protein BJX67DRAFT_379934 [Aspergillus lucknowensis]|uniref:C2 domain-containing protein n=1 Tax=Aspergillus lucknowensis TaxID=176173 RepID=A0ABR4LYV8_9EURO
MAAKPLRMTNLNHAAGIFADMSVDGPAIGTLVAIVDRAKNLPNRKTMGKQNPYCAARLGKEAKKTDTDLRGGQTPKWDQELRFTVHESPDYLRLKLSVFNDDKRTDLIGETWIDLKDLIIPGGSQSDQWHPLQFRGKYAGEIRLEMTYYDTRPEDEAVIERRTQGVDRTTVKSNSSSGPAPVGSSSSSLSGPRQLKEVKRRPLPTDPTGSTAPRPLPEKAHFAPVPMPVPSHSNRPAPYEGVPTPPSSSGLDYTQQPRHTAPHEAHYDSAHDLPSPAMRPKVYETPDDFQRDWNDPAPGPAYHAPPVGPPRRHQQAYTQEQHYPPHRERSEPQDHYARPRSGYDNAPPADYRSMRQDLQTVRQEPYHHEPPRPSSHHMNQPYPSQAQYTYAPEEPQPPRYHHTAGSMSSGRRIDYPQEDLEQDRHYRAHRNSLPMRDRSSGRSHGRQSGRDYHAEYAAMQPRVEDEDEEGSPPPPPVHRSGLVQTHQQLVPSPTHSYQAYSPEYGPRTTQEINTPQPTQLTLEEEDKFQDLPPVTGESHMPPSLVAGFDPEIADVESDRVANEIQARRRSGIFEEDLAVVRSREPSPILPPYPTRNPPAEDNRRSLTARKSVDGGGHSQQLVLRKSISPRPAPSRGRGNSHASSFQTPFSPDSFDAYNPHAARSAVSQDPAPAYETPAEAMEAARRNEAAASRQQGPIIGDDGREIDPTDHLPTDTWAPEPDRKSRKPGVIVRFRNAPPRTTPRSGLPAPQKEYASSSTRPKSSFMSDAVDRTSPGGDYNRGRQGYGGSHSPEHGRTYRTPSPQPQPRRHSVSPSPSPMYAPANAGPPIPAKVPISAPTEYTQDPLSRELNSINIGSVGYISNRTMRKYAPKTITGYAM